MLDKDIEKILITREEIQNRCSELGKELTEIYKDKNPLVVGVLKGAVPFMADIVRKWTVIWNWTLWMFLVMETRQFLLAK